MTRFTASKFRKYLDRFPPQRWLNLHNTDGTPEEHQNEAWRVEATPAGLTSLPVYDADVLLARIPTRLTLPDRRRFDFVETTPNGRHAAFFRRTLPDGTTEMFPREGEQVTTSNEREDAIAKLLLELIEAKFVTL